MEPIPETLEAINELDACVDDGTLLVQLTATAYRAGQAVPGLVGVSLASRMHDITFTLIATNEDIATLDAVQYIASGPCVDAIDLGHGIAIPDGLLSESRWQYFARASAAAGVLSTLTLPVVEAGEVVSTVNLYGSTENTFTDKHRVLADIFGAWAPGAVANADLSFSTRSTAERAPIRLREAAVVDTATGILAAERDLTVSEARAQLDDAANRAGIAVYKLARVVVGLHHDE